MLSFVNLQQIETLLFEYGASGFLGVVPGERSSGSRRKLTSLTKAGSIVARRHRTANDACWRMRRVFKFFVSAVGSDLKESDGPDRPRTHKSGSRSAEKWEISDKGNPI